ncbi:MAG TPA: hypothetical protein VFA85_10980 [Terriglobales bacterium]|nr:hypothetical protein [Terriglobales bacterium]
MFRTLTVLMVFFISFVSFSAQAQTATCTGWQTFKRIDGRKNTRAFGINNFGTVVGGTDSGYHGTEPPAFVRYPNGSITIFRYHGLQTTFSSRNSQGVTVGYYRGPQASGVPTGHVHGIVVYGSKVVTINYPKSSDTGPLGINKWGTIVGYYQLPGSTHMHGFEYKNGKFSSVQFPNSTDTVVQSINDNGVMVGFELQGSGVYESFILKNGTFTTIKAPKATGATFVYDINNSGVMVGDYIVGVNPQSFIYSNKFFKDIDVPNANPYANAFAINDHNQVAGEEFTVDGSSGFIAHCE